MMTAGVAALIGDVTRSRGFQKRAELLRAVRDYDNFDIDNDPYGERDYGIFEFESATLYWKIDYYDRALAFGSDNPSDPNGPTDRKSVVTGKSVSVGVDPGGRRSIKTKTKQHR